MSQYVYAILLVILSTESCLPTAKDPWAKDNVAKRGSRAFDFLSRFALHPPRFSYNDAEADKHRNDLQLLDYFSWNVEWWQSLFQEAGVTNAEINDTGNYYCPSEPFATYPNDSCPDASYISFPWYVVDDLRTSLPSDACNETTDDPHCFAWMNMVLKPINETGLLGELENQKNVAEQNNTNTYYKLIADYIGVGFPVNQECRKRVTETLESVDKFNEVGWAAATTLTALIPALLTIGNLFVPRSSEVFATSFLVGVMSAMFSLGLPVKSISGISSSQYANVGTFSFKTRHWLMRFGKKAEYTDNGKHSANEEFDIATFQKWSADFDPWKREDDAEELFSTDWIFSSIKQDIRNWKKRATFWQLPALFIAGTQFALFLLAIGPLFLSYGTPLLLFDCGNHWTSIWLLIAAAISATFRFAMWEKGVHERVSAFALSDLTILHFRNFIRERPYHHHFTGKYLENTKTDLPPLYPPLLNTLGSATNSIISRVFTRKASFNGLSNASNLRINPHNFRDFFQGLFHNFQLVKDTTVSILKDPRTFIKAGFRMRTPPAAARRSRPLIILMHLSTDGRNPLVTLFTGLIEGFILILLTAFFSAQWGGNLFVMCYTTAILLVSITIGRALGLFYVTHSADVYSLHVIETQDQEQIRGCLRILCSMEETLIHVNGAWYFEGYRLDQRPGWQNLQRSYNQGEFDGPDGNDSPPRYGSTTGSFSQYLSGPMLSTDTAFTKRKPLSSPPPTRMKSTTSNYSRLSRSSFRRSNTTARTVHQSTSSIQLLSLNPYTPLTMSPQLSPVSSPSTSRRPSLLRQSSEPIIPLHTQHAGL